MLIDPYGRIIDYLRISVTDRCNLRCCYCMPPFGIEAVSQGEILSFEEIIRLIKIFISLGIKRIRFTGGEPLVRKGIVSLIERVTAIKEIEDIVLTTNGVLLSQYADILKKAGLKRINVSLDTLNPQKFKMITGSDSLFSVLEGIKIAQELDFPLKLNMVVMRGINDNEIIDFIKFASKNNLILRFIEFMKVTPLWREDYFISIEKVKEFCERKFRLVKTQEKLGFGPAQYYKINGDGLLGFIKTDENNCKDCSRLRLTSTGELKICLYEQKGLYLKEFLRGKLSDMDITNIIKAKIGMKKGVHYKLWSSPKFYMSHVGG